jgi:hypothetical protein
MTKAGSSLSTKITWNLLLALFLAAQASVAADNDSCAKVEKFGKATQMIPKSGPVVTRFSSEDAIPCGAMVITHSDGFWFKLSNEVVVKLGPNTFFEMGPKAVSTHRLYRGDALLSGPAGSGHLVVTTPNGEVHFEGGVFSLQYQTQTRTTSVASFNKTVEFKNKFNSAAGQKVNVGEISRLTIHDIRVVPSQPVAMSPSSVKEGIAVFGLPEADRDEMVAIVSRVFENRAKTLISDLENFNDIPESEDQARAPASLKRYQPAVDEKEAEFTMKMLRRRLYEGDESIERKSVDERAQADRKPASVETQTPKIEDRRKKLQDQKRKVATDQVLKDISTLNIEE